MKLLFMNALLFMADPKPSADNPLKEFSNFLTNEIVGGMLAIVTPIATLSFLGLGVAALMATDESSRSKFKSGLWWAGIATAVCFMAQYIVPFLQRTLGDA